MKLPIPKALLVYLALLAAGCILVSYKTNTVNKTSADVAVSAENENDALSVDSSPKTPVTQQTEENPEEKLTVNSALSLLYEGYNSAEKLAGSDNVLAEELFKQYVLGDMLIDGEELIHRNEFAVLCTRLIELIKLKGLGTVYTDVQINDIYYIPDVYEGLPYSECILELYRLGIVAGNDDYGNYEPHEVLLRGNAAVMVNRVISPELRVKTDIPGNKIKSCLPVEAILQNPELPSGCEITSLTMVLNYLGFDADKCDLADNYLEKGPEGKTDYRVAFIGNPRSWGPYGCFAPVIVNAAQKYLDEKGSALKAYDTTGFTLEDLFIQIDQGYPVIIWGTMGMRAGFESTVWIIDGVRVPWIANEHCMVLHGYDREKNIVLVADPLEGNVEYDMDLFETRFKELFMQSVVIK